MTKSEEHKIRDYLLSKKLPIDILLEVNDHFISEISNLEVNEGLDFIVAFEKTKENWKKDLNFSKPFYKIGNKGIPITNFERKFKREVNYNISKISFLVSFLLIIGLFLISFFTNYLVFSGLLNFFLISSITFGFGLIVYNWVFNYHTFRNKFKNYKISVYQWHIFWVFSVGYFGLVYLNPIDIWTKEIFNHQLSFVTFLKSTTYSILIFSYVFTGINQIKFLQTLRKLKAYLKVI